MWLRYKITNEEKENDKVDDFVIVFQRYKEYSGFWDELFEILH